MACSNMKPDGGSSPTSMCVGSGYVSVLRSGYDPFSVVSLFITMVLDVWFRAQTNVSNPEFTFIAYQITSRSFLHCLSAEPLS